MEKETKKISEKISELFWCFVVFSILGMFTEMAYCFATMGIIESRQGLVWGPFCPIYGVGAVIAIVLLDRVKDSRIKLFLNGALIGSIVEYVTSYVLEAMYGTRFWDYSYLNFNLNGRICLTYSIFWGILAVVVMRKVSPLFNKLAKKIQASAKIRILEKMVFVFLVIDAFCTVWAINIFKTNAKNIYYDREEQENSKLYNFGSKIFTNEYMLKAFPNIRFITDEGEEIYIRDVIK